MKAIILFDLSEQDERKEHLRCSKATDMACVLFEITHNLKRKMITNNTPPEYIEGVDDTIIQILELCQEHGIDIDDLIS